MVKGAQAYFGIKSGKLVFADMSGKEEMVLGEDNIRNDAVSMVFKSGKYLYYVDSSSVLWKVAKNGSTRESLGYIKMAVYVK